MVSPLYNPIDRTDNATPSKATSGFAQAHADLRVAQLISDTKLAQDTGRRFPVGGIVYLKSGSPPMTVNSIRGPSQVGRAFISVEWFNGKEIKRDCFDPECLVTEKPAA